MKKMRILVGLAIAGAVLSAWFPARGQTIDDFRVGSSINSGGVADLAVTPNDRFIVVLGSTQLRYLDTWNFRMVPDSLGVAASTSVIGGTTASAKALTLSPDGAFAFVSRSDGVIVTVGLTPLYSLVPWQALATGLAVAENTVVPTGATIKSIDHIVAVPDLTAGQPDHLLFTAGIATYSCAVSSGVLAATVNTYADNLTGKSVTELVRGKSYAYELYHLNSFPQMRIHSCNSNIIALGCAPFKEFNAPGGLDGATALAGLAADRRSDAFALTSDSGLDQLWLIDVGQFTFTKTALTSPAALKLALLSGPLLSPDLVFSAETGAARVGITPLAAVGVAFGGTTHELAAPEFFTRLAASSGADGYVYGSGGNSVRPVTANPLFDPVVVTPGTTVTSGFTVEIMVHSAQELAVTGAGIFTDQVFGYANWTHQLPGLSLVLGGPIGETTELVLHGDSAAVAALPNECGNVLTVVASDTLGHKGRTAFTVNVDRVPPAQPFSLSFGDKELFYGFKVLKLCDLARIEVWYGTSPTLADGYTSLAALDHIVANYGSLTEGQQLSGTIKGLANGVIYYAWTVVFDRTGHRKVSAAQSSMPQTLLTLTDLTHEKGGGGCFGAVTGRRRGDPAALVLLLAPLLIGGGLRVGRRVMMRRGKR